MHDSYSIVETQIVTTHHRTRSGSIDRLEIREILAENSVVTRLSFIISVGQSYQKRNVKHMAFGLALWWQTIIMILRNKVSDKDKGCEKPEKFQYDSLQIGGVTPTRWGPTNKCLTRPPLRSHTQKTELEPLLFISRRLYIC